MEKEIASLEAQAHILKLEKEQMAGELRTKQAIIDHQVAEMLKLRQDFAESVKQAKERDGKKLKAVLNGLRVGFKYSFIFYSLFFRQETLRN